MYAVVTYVSPPTENGNLYTGLTDIYVEVEAPSDANGYAGRYELYSAQRGATNALDLMLQNFRLGEVLRLDSNGRDQFSRKPSKWDVGLEFFDDANQAFDRAFEVCREASKN